MNLILRVILASMVSLPVAAIFLVVGLGILFLTPFTATPLFGRLPRVSESFCPEGAGLVVERYSRSSLSQAKNDYRVICLDSAGKRVAALGASAMVGYLIAWLALFRLVRRLVEEKTIREKWFLLWTFSAGVALLVWGAIYVYRQPTNPEREQAMMVTLAVAVVLAAVFLTAHRYLLKRIGKRL
jgi:amino acid transporter